MEHSITVGDVVSVCGVALGIILLIGFAIWLLSIFASEWDH